MKCALFLGAVAACYSPHAKPGAPCSPMGECPSGLSCAADGLCELPGAIVIDAPTDGPLIDGPPDAEVCTPEICGDGIDQNCDGIDPACPPNDGPTGAIDITAGGDFTGDLTAAHDDYGTNGTAACGTTGGRDLYYKITAAKAQIYYIDTFGSDFDTVVKVYPGTCTTGFVAGTVCHNDQCNVKQTQWVGLVAAGDNCVVVDQHDATVTAGQLMMHVEPGYWAGTLLPGGPGKVTASTTAGLVDDSSATCGGTGAPDKAYYMVGCPGTTQTLSATTCSASTAYNTVLYVFGPTKTELACNDNDAACAASANDSTLTDVQLVGAHLFWLVVDGPTSTDSGAFSLTTTLQ